MRAKLGSMFWCLAILLSASLILPVAGLAQDEQGTTMKNEWFPPGPHLYVASGSSNLCKALRDWEMPFRRCNSRG